MTIVVLLDKLGVVDVVGVNLSYTRKSILTQGRTGTARYSSLLRKAAFGWIDWIVGGELPLNFCENELTRKNAGLSPNSKATLKKYLTALVAFVEGSLSIIAGELYALLFDGWSAGSDHFVAVFICYTKGGERKRHLLAFASLIDETNQTAPNHKDFILRTLERFNIDPRGAVCLSGDNCATNISTARLLGVPLVDCSSHRMNLAPERVFKKYEVELNLIAAVMRKLSTTKASGHLRRLAPLKPVRRNAIRWSSKFDMVDRFLEILVPARTVMLQVEDPALMPSPAQVARVKSLRKNELSIFQSVSMALQDECTSLADVRAIFEDVVEVLPETAHHLGTDAAIVKFRHFEDAIVKIQQGNQGELLAVELKAVRKLVASPTELNADGDVEDVGFAGRALKRRRLAAEQDHKFVDTTFLQPTSNAAERLFSMAKRLYKDKRKRLLPRTLEQLIFLRANRDMWGLAEVAQVVDQVE
ncbi:hypothetical protein PF002_g5301 [Phytophthora fragariae]|uniref:HAT C-terminal dimerisation domain-containing protein n=1 Tax=Phytophthora fragariae TaxID=53985 RepID=A0A6A4A1H7_9STRA|nr:hypothetical protein PF002_g5301 [Phytophthora fragariae]